MVPSEPLRRKFLRVLLVAVVQDRVGCADEREVGGFISSGELTTPNFHAMPICRGNF